MSEFKHRTIVITQKPSIADKLIKGMAVTKMALSLYSTYLITKEIIKAVKKGKEVEIKVKDSDETKGE